jgi:hypothetical protein
LSVRYSYPPWRHVILLRISHGRSNRSSASFSRTTFQNFPGISDILADVPQVSAPYKTCAPNVELY